MVAFLTRFAAVMALVGLTACQTSNSTSIPQTQSVRQTAVRGFSVPPPAATRLWAAECYTCGIAMVHAKTIDAQAYDAASGTDLHDFTFPDGHGTALYGVTNPSQNAVYFTAVSNGSYQIAAISTATYAVKHFVLPVSAASNSVQNLLVSPDGTRLYLPTQVNGGGSGALYVVNATTGGVIHQVTVDAERSALSPDGATLWAQTPAGLASIDTSSFTTTVFAADPGALSMAATASRLYVGTNTHVAIYNATTHALIGSLANGTLPERLAVDPSAGRLFVWNNGASTSAVLTYNTSTKALISTVDGVFWGPSVDLLTHVVYELDTNGDICTQSPPSYAQSCSSTQINPAAATLALTTSN